MIRNDKYLPVLFENNLTFQLRPADDENDIILFNNITLNSFLILTTRVELINSVNLSNQSKLKKKKKKTEVKLFIEKEVEENYRNNPVVITSQEDPFGLLAKGIIDWCRSLFENKKKKMTHPIISF